MDNINKFGISCVKKKEKKKEKRKEKKREKKKRKKILKLTTTLKGQL